MSQKIDIRERRYNGVDYDTLHPETNINMVLDSGGNSVGGVNGALYGDGNGNIVGAAISNLNLLDNPWFTVNQRGFTSGTFASGQYVADRWATSYSVNSDGTLAVANDGGIAISGASAGTSMLYQKMERLTLGKVYTLSALIDGIVYSANASINNTSDSIAKAIEDKGTLYLYYAGGRWFCQISINSGKSFFLRAVKLEPGSVSTLANDVAPNYTTELLKCQRYFVRIKAGSDYSRIAMGIIASPTTKAIFPLRLSVPMVGTPTLSNVGNALVGIGAGSKVVSSFAIETTASEYIAITAMIDEGFSASTTAMLLLRSGAYIDLSADL